MRMSKKTSRTGCWLWSSDDREFVAARAGLSGGAVRPAANAKLPRAGKQRNLSPELAARSMQCASRKWSSRLCVLINPILPCAFHWDHAGEMLETTSLAARNNLQRTSGSSISGLTKSQTFGTTPQSNDASVNEPSHADIHRHAQRQERKQHRRSTVTH
jgi:hypothetical protein